MLGVIPYTDSRNIYSLEFKSADQQRKTIIVCPNPNIADDFREKHLNESHSSESEVITISKFVNDLIQNKLSEITFTRKSELLLILAGVWKTKFNHLPKETFLQSFQYFTDLRSYTFDKELINEVLLRLDPTFREAIELFWLISDNEALNINDEHKAYNLLADYFREANDKEEDEEVDRDYVFYGFTHLSGSQIDFLKSLGIRNDVYIPLPASVLKTSKKSDWINWLENQDYQDEEENQGFLTTPEIPTINIISFQKNRLGECINNFVENEKLSQMDIYLSKKNPTFLELNEVSIKGAAFKSLSGMLDPALKKVQTLLLEMVKEEESSSTKVLEFLEQLISEVLKKKNDIDYRLIKVTELYKKSLSEMLELSDAFKEVDIFTLYILNEIVQLNVPRIFNYPISKDELNVSVRGLESIEGFDTHNKTLLIAKSGYGKLKSQESVYHEDIMEILASIGPVRRAEFEYQILRHKLLEVLSSPNTVLMLEEGVIEHDPCWSEILKYCNLNDVSSNTKFINSPRINPMARLKTQKKELSNRFSASRIQSFLDCKQKFFFSYINKLDTWNRPTNRILPNDLGTMEHEVIERYLTENQEYDFENHSLLSKKILDEFIKTYFVNLEFLEYRKYLIEIQNYSRAGINVLLNFKKLDPDCEYCFEVPINKSEDYELIGSVDCIVKTNSGIMIFDFKRSAASIPSFSGWKEFSKIQLWFYANYANIEIKEITCLGYLNLSDIKESLVMPTSKENYDEINEIIGTKVNKKEYPFLDLSLEFKEFCHNTICEIREEVEFLPNPKNNSVCTYCPVANLCTRGGEVYV